MSLLLRLSRDSVIAKKYVDAAKQFKFFSETLSSDVLTSMEGMGDVRLEELEDIWRSYNSFEKEMSRRGYKTIDPIKMSSDYCNKCITDLVLEKRKADEKPVLYSVLALKGPKVETAFARYGVHSTHPGEDKAVSSPSLRR